MIATWKFPRSLPRSALYAVTEGILRQTGVLVTMKTKSTSRLNVENDLIYASSCIEFRISVLSKQPVAARM